MRKQKIEADLEKQRKINFLLKIGYSIEDANKMRLKVSSCNSYLYWMYKGMSKEEAIQKVSSIQKLKSPRCIEYWINKGFSENDAKNKVSNYQDNVSFKEGDDIVIYQKKCNNRRINKDKYIFLYGEEKGRKKWEEKKNKSRVTYENMVRVYGEELGLCRWNEYLEKQRKSQSESILIEKHGITKGIEIINHRKNLNKLCVEKYIKTGDSKYLNNNYSKSSQKLFWSIYEKLPDNIRNKCYFKELNHEYVLLLDNGLCYLYDFVISNINICVEFNGDIWHANPEKYKPEDIIFEKKAKDIWINDEKKIQTLKEKRDIDTIVIWESKWSKTKIETEKILMNLINIRLNTK